MRQTMPPSTTVRPAFVLVLSVVLSLVLLGTCSVVGHDETASDVDPLLLHQLREGHTILLFRHALTDRSASDLDPTARGTCEQQRNLSTDGIEQAHHIGRRLRALDIPVGRTFASPFCRTVDTAEAMTGEATTTDAFLSLTAALDAAGADAITEAGRALIAEQLQSPDVTVVVTHTQNIEALAEVTVGEGDAAVVDASGFVGVVHADEW